MKYMMALALAVLMGCQSAPTVAPPAAANVATRGPAATPASAIGSIGPLLNAARAAEGRRALSEDARLTQAATAFAQDMRANDYFSHRGRDGSDFARRARAAGYSCASAENIAFGQRDTAEVMQAWMTSTGHRRVILSSNASEFGLGRAGEYWVLLLGRGTC